MARALRGAGLERGQKISAGGLYEVGVALCVLSAGFLCAVLDG